MPELAIQKTELSAGWVSIAVEGEIDLATADQLSKAIDEVLSGGSENLVVDLNGSSFMDSTGLKTLVMAERNFSDDGREFVIAVNGGPISRLLDLSGVESSMRVVAKPGDVAELENEK